MVLPGAIPARLLDALDEAFEQMLREPQDYGVRVGTGLHPYRPLRDYDREVVEEMRSGARRFRVIDFYSYSIAAKKISLHPTITGFLEHLLQDRVVVLQSLDFWTGSEQALHQDFAFVEAAVRSQLVASWVALEDISPDAGPLNYIPGSHQLPKFDWGQGPYRTPETKRTAKEFEAHILEQARLAGLTVLEFTPKRGDVFIWHAALAHGGGKVNDRSLTRKSHVTHYSAASTHHWDYRKPDITPERREFLGGFYHVNPIDREGEDTIRAGDSVDV